MNVYGEQNRNLRGQAENLESCGIEGMGGCLCIGCLEKRIGRTLTARDFDRKSPLNLMPGSARLEAKRAVLKSRVMNRLPRDDGGCSHGT